MPVAYVLFASPAGGGWVEPRSFAAFIVRTAGCQSALGRRGPATPGRRRRRGHSRDRCADAGIDQSSGNGAGAAARAPVVVLCRALRWCWPASASLASCALLGCCSAAARCDPHGARRAGRRRRLACGRDDALDDRSGALAGVTVGPRRRTGRRTRLPGQADRSNDSRPPCSRSGPRGARRLARACPARAPNRSLPHAPRRLKGGAQEAQKRRADPIMRAACEAAATPRSPAAGIATRVSRGASSP